jgi:hypothetical protein
MTYVQGIAMCEEDRIVLPRDYNVYLHIYQEI